MTRKTPPPSPATEVDLPDLTPWLLARLLKQVSAAIAVEDVDGLRASHLRLLTVVPPEGTGISALAEAVAMTKQACGQFVTHLVATGHLEVRVPAADRRSRLVLRTAAGDEAAVRFDRLVRGVETGWAERLGAEGWTRFRRDLLLLLDEPSPARDPRRSG